MRFFLWDKASLAVQLLFSQETADPGVTYLLHRITSFDLLSGFGLEIKSPTSIHFAPANRT